MNVFEIDPELENVIEEFSPIKLAESRKSLTKELDYEQFSPRKHNKFSALSAAVHDIEEFGRKRQDSAKLDDIRSVIDSKILNYNISS